MKNAKDKKSFDMNIKELDKLIKMLGNDQLPEIKVGILGKSNKRSDSKLSNASIGAKHEFGSEGMVQRSFLRMPLNEKYGQYLKSTNLLDKNTLKKAIKEKGLVSIAKSLGVLAEQVIADAFDSGGFGKWKPSNMEFKDNHQTLVETQQLRNSITSEVKEK